MGGEEEHTTRRLEVTHEKGSAYAGGCVAEAGEERLRFTPFYMFLNFGPCGCIAHSKELTYKSLGFTCLRIKHLHKNISEEQHR